LNQVALRGTPRPTQDPRGIVGSRGRERPGERCSAPYLATPQLLPFLGSARANSSVTSSKVRRNSAQSLSENRVGSRVPRKPLADSTTSTPWFWFLVAEGEAATVCYAAGSLPRQGSSDLHIRRDVHREPIGQGDPEIADQDIHGHRRDLRSIMQARTNA
jgi:hypothetical protein